jgi:predicted enzyme related to lactoylglutathione lyase
MPGIHVHWLYHFAVPDLDASVAKVRTQGGAVIAVLDAKGGRFAPCEDAQGAAFGLCALQAGLRI